MEMKPEDAKKYNIKFPVGRPKVGRFAPDRQFFQCETDEQVKILEAAGWTGNPFDHGYKPEAARFVEKWDDVKVDCEPPAPAVDQNASLKAELEAARAELAALKGTNNIPAAVNRGGRPRKVPA